MVNMAFMGVGDCFDLKEVKASLGFMYNPAKIIAHGTVGGLSSLASGGKFASGFAAGAMSQAASVYRVYSAIGATDEPKGFGDYLWNAVASGMVGGAASTATGGSFEHGAITAAMGRLFNDLAHSGAASDAGKKFLAVASDFVGKVWSLPNTIIGLAYGGLGYTIGKIGYSMGWMDQNPEINIGNNAIQFLNNPLMGSAMTFGNVIVYGGSKISGQQTSDYSPNSTLGGYSPTTLGNEEMQHTYQAQVLGPFYFVAHGLLGMAGMINSGRFTSNGWHQSPNILESGPHSQGSKTHIPSAWGF